MFKVAFAFVLLLLLGTTRPVQAALQISEVYPYPTSGNEWVEIYNPDPDPITLTSWTLSDLITSPATIYQFNSSHVIPPLGYLSIEITNKLNNAGDGVAIKDPDGNIIDEMQYTSAIQGQSWARIDGVFIQATPSRNQTNALPSPTPTPVATPTPTPTSSPSPGESPAPTPATSPTPSPTPTTFDPYDILLSEIMACPTDTGAEWLELYNPTDDAMLLENWQITDWAGNHRTFDLTLPPHTYTAISWLSSMLNNGGDSLFLEDNSGDIIASANFPACSNNHSFVWLDNRWQLTQTPTENQTNQLTIQPSPSPSPQPTPSPTPSATPKSSPRPSPSPSSSPSPHTTATITQPPTGKILGATTDSAANQLADTATPPYPTDYTTNLTLQTSPLPNLLTDPTEFLAIKPSKVTFWSAISVILGGGIIAATGAYVLYDHYEETITRNMG